MRFNEGSQLNWAELAYNWGPWVLVLWVGVTGYGVWLGLDGRATVFRDITDFGLIGATCAIGTLGLVIAYLSVNQGRFHHTIFIALLCLAAVVGLIGWSTKRCIEDNPRARFWLPALVARLSLGTFFLVSLYGLINPSGKTQVERASNRGADMLFVLLLTPLMIKLVRDKAGLRRLLPPGIAARFF